MKTLRQQFDAEISALETLKRVYRKHHLHDDSIGWDELADEIRDALCELMGDERFQEFVDQMIEAVQK